MNLRQKPSPQIHYYIKPKSNEHKGIVRERKRIVRRRACCSLQVMIRTLCVFEWGKAVNQQGQVMPTSEVQACLGLLAGQMMRASANAFVKVTEDPPEKGVKPSQISL